MSWVRRPTSTAGSSTPSSSRSRRGSSTSCATSGREGVGTPSPDLVARLSEWGLTRERATWAVLTWADHLPEATLPPPVLTAEPPGTRPEALAPTTLPPMVTGPAQPAPLRWRPT